MTAYETERQRWATALAGEERRFRAIGLARFVVFVVGVVLAVLAVTSGRVAPGWVLVPAIGFAVLIIWHERVTRRRNRARRSMAYYDRGLARLRGEWTVGGDEGDRFADERHLYATDLEIFGSGSLFHLLSNCRTETGAARLADWLRHPASPDEIRDRQPAVRELAKQLPLRHELAVIGPEVETGLDSATLRAWAAAPAVPFFAWLGWVVPLAAALNVIGLFGWAIGWWQGYVAVAMVLVSSGLAQIVQRRARAVLQAADAPERQLVLLAALLDRVASLEFETAWLRALGDRWRRSGDAPGVEVRRLARLVDLVDARRNQLFAPIAGLLLLGTQLAIAIERWRRRVGPAVVDWVDAVGDLEAMVSLATYAFEHPEAAFPSVETAHDGFEAEGIAHPLLPRDPTVPNDVRLQAPCQLVVVSGSNMSGKSTLLKAIGVNLVLAQAGAPVRARAMTTRPFAIGASLVLRDSLLEGRSRFFAEIIRLRDIVELTGAERPVLFLLDELLSGTNSHDRAIGAGGLLRGLLERGATGFVTTHDLALTAIAETLGPRAANWHFEDRLVDGKLEFDYRLEPGVVKRSNAIELMRSVGLDVGAGVRSEAESQSE